MSKHRKKGNSLHPLQKKIVLNLSKNGPQNIHETFKKMKTQSYEPSYKPTNIAFHSLQEKGILTKVKSDSDKYKGRRYPKFWLTEQGILTALNEGASPKDLLTQSRKVYPDNQILQCYLEMAPNLNPNIVTITLTALKNKGKLEPSDLGAIFATQMETDTTLDKFTNALETLKKYPKEHENFKKQIALIQENLAKAVEIINKPEEVEQFIANLQTTDAHGNGEKSKHKEKLRKTDNKRARSLSI
jgi:hypothetical protein